MTTSTANHYIATRSFNDLVAALLTPAPHFDRQTQIIELLLGVGLAPMSCLLDRDAAELAQADLDAAMKHHTGTLTDADRAALETFRANQERNYAAQIELAQHELADAA